jgi:hypothetical protein
MEEILETVVLAFAKAQEADLGHHDGPAENRGQKKHEEDQLSLECAFRESIDNTCGDHHLCSMPRIRGLAAMLPSITET